MGWQHKRKAGHVDPVSDGIGSRRKCSLGLHERSTNGSGRRLPVFSLQRDLIAMIAMM
jgi:hypothetical protein